jgi:hypothetical protein
MRTPAGFHVEDGVVADVSWRDLFVLVLGVLEELRGHTNRVLHQFLVIFGTDQAYVGGNGRS